MDAALKLYPDAAICAVNYATELVRCDYLATVHGNLVIHFLDAYQYENDPIVIQQDNDISGAIGKKLHIPTHGGSAPFAAAAMVMEGFDLVIMCGCPITGEGGYAQTRYETNLSWNNPNANRIKRWSSGMKDYKQNFPEIAGKIRSMSGNTKEIFGGIHDIRH